MNKRLRMRMTAAGVALLLAACGSYNFIYDDGGYSELQGKWYIVMPKEQFILNGSNDEIIQGGPYEKETQCLLDLYQTFEPDDGYICTRIKDG